MQSEAAPGVRSAGKLTAGRIIKAARDLLAEAGYAQFSMRNVAARADLRLSNVQYYFPTRDDLVRALFVDADTRYREEYAAVLAAAPHDRRMRFEAVLDFNLRDVARSDTRRFFIQLWALLNSLDQESGSLLSDFYQIDLQHLSEHIAELVPDLDPREIRRRATLLAALIEGLMVVRGAHSPVAAEMKRLTAAARELGMKIALGTQYQALVDS